MTGMLASVRSLAEARIVLAAGADVIDLKEPSAGALGALDPDTAACIVEFVNGRTTVSATIGDVPFDRDALRPAIERTAAAGVDMIKVGVFGGSGVLESSAGLAALELLADCRRLGNRVVLILFAEDLMHDPRFADAVTAGGRPLLPLLSSVGITGVMLDTREKRTGSLTEKLPMSALKGFVERAGAANLLTGLAGSLRMQDIEPLLELGPDYLGFRSALCRNGERGAGLDAEAVGYCVTAVTCTRLSEKLGA